MSKSFAPFALVALLFLAAACDSSTGPEGTGRVVLQLASGTGAALGSPAAPSLVAEEIVLTSVEIVARKIRLKQEDGACPVEDGEGEGEQDGDCPALWVDPTLLEPPLVDGAATEFTVDLPEGTYDELKLQIHKPTGSQKDVIFLADHPDFEGISIRVIGTFNGEPFEFTTSLTAVIEVDLEEPIEVAEGVPVAITLLIDALSWFDDGNGGCLDPSSTSQQVRSQIEQNIRNSFKAFEDNDADGENN